MNTHHDFMIDTPVRYAKRLAGYISSPTKIESLTRLEFGRAPPLHQIAQMRLSVEMDGKRRQLVAEHKCTMSADNDGLDFNPGKPPKQTPVPRVRDYIDQPGPIRLLPEPPRENPFIGLVSVATRVARSVALDFGIPTEILLGSRRNKEIAYARSVVINLLARRGHGMAEIGRRLGKDRTTIGHAMRSFDIYRRANEAVEASWQRHLKLIEEADAQAEAEAA